MIWRIIARPCGSGNHHRPTFSGERWMMRAMFNATPCIKEI
jgi:hypothetical protein